MIEIGKTYKSNGGHTVTVTDISDDVVYYKDLYGCTYHKAARFFAGVYISNDAYYQIKMNAIMK